MRILIVDDENVSRKKMEIILRSFGSIQSVDTGIAAVTAFRTALLDKQPFNLISLDISMPVMSGDETLRQIRAIEKENRVEEGNRALIIMVTGVADRDTVKFCKSDGCDNFIVKPFVRETVIAKLRAMGISQIDRNA
jgi:two-component system chemotaxis response regulator CheY